MYKLLPKKTLILMASSIIVSGCSSSSLDGTVMPLPGGEYKAISLAEEKKEAFEIAAHDAEITCEDKGGAYEVISQEAVIESDESDSGNKLVDAAVDLTKLSFGFGGKEYEIVTKFKCTKAKKSGWW